MKGHLLFVLNNIPQINAETFGVVEHEFLYHRDKNKNLDIEFIEYIRDENPGLAKLISIFVSICSNTTEYRKMITAVMTTIKSIDIQLDTEKLEQINKEDEKEL
jgi:hypothetical protein